MHLREYQVRAKTLIREAFQAGKRSVVLCVPTGGGKTVIFADMLRDAMRAGSRSMVLCNRKELIEQANNKMRTLELKPTLIIPSYTDKVSNLYLASIDTLRNRKLPEIDFLIVDEAHIKAFDEFILYYKERGVFIVLCTASPLRYGKRFLNPKKLRPEFETLPDLYPDYAGRMGDIADELVIPTSIPILLSEGFLMPAITYAVDVDLSDVGTAQKFGEVDYSESQMFQKADNPISYKSVVDKYLELAPGTKAICFNINIEHSKNQTKEFQRRGITSAHLDGNTPKEEREKMLRDFKAGLIMVLNNYGIVVTGYDEPTIETVIANFATLSLVKWLQACGRGSRPCEEIGKSFFNVIDMYGNVYRHMPWQFPHEFSIAKGWVSKKVGVAPIKECEHCQAIIALTATTCIYCNLLQEKKSHREELMKMQEAGKFVVVDNNTVPKELKKPLHQMSVAELEKYRELKEYAIGWLVRQIVPRGTPALEEYANLKGYARAWVTKQLEIAESGRVVAKEQVWQFIKDNTHLCNEEATNVEFIRDYAYKKLKATHTVAEMEILMPKILKVAIDLGTGTIKVEDYAKNN